MATRKLSPAPQQEYITLERREPIGTIMLGGGDGNPLVAAFKMGAEYMAENLGISGMNIEFEAFDRTFRLGAEPLAQEFHGEDEF